MKRMLALMGLLAVPALAENPAPESRAGVPQAAFDDVRYALGYDFKSQIGTQFADGR